MDPQPDDSPRAAAPQLEAVLARLRATVEERRRAGEYPPGMEDELEAELRRIVSRRSSEVSVGSTRDELDRRGPFPAVDPGRVTGATTSGFPGGAALHAAVARLVGHQTAGILTQVQELSNASWDALVVLADAITALEARLGDQPSIVAIVDALVEQVAAFERAPAPSQAGLNELARRIERLEAAEASRIARPWFSAELGLGTVGDPGVAGASDPARSDPARSDPARSDPARSDPARSDPARSDPAVWDLAALAEEAAKIGPVLLLRPGSGPGLADPLLELGSAPDSSLGAVVVVDLLEHLGAQQVLDLVRNSVDKLVPGGRLLARAANPRSLWGLAHGAAGRPDRVLVDPGWLALCCREAGFVSVEVAWGEAPGRQDTEDEVRRVIFGPISYTLTASR